jgi:hypothetical protein
MIHWKSSLLSYLAIIQKELEVLKLSSQSPLPTGLSMMLAFLQKSTPAQSSAPYIEQFLNSLIEELVSFVDNMSPMDPEDAEMLGISLEVHSLGKRSQSDSGVCSSL